MNTTSHIKTLSANAHYIAKPTEWQEQLTGYVRRTLQHKLSAIAAKTNAVDSLLAICPFTFATHKIDCSAIPLAQDTRLPRNPLLVLHPMLTAYLPSTTEASLPLEWLIYRGLFTLANKNILLIAAPLSLANVNRRRAAIALENIITLASLNATKISQLPAYAIEDNTSFTSLCVWLAQAANIAKTGIARNITEADLDNLTTASEREILRVERIEQAKINAARKSAQRKLAKITLIESLYSVAAIMDDMPHTGWADIHTTKLFRLADKKHNVDIGWIDAISDLLENHFPDEHFVGLKAYTHYLFVRQHLDNIVAESLIFNAGMGADFLTSTEQKAQNKLASRHNITNGVLVATVLPVQDSHLAQKTAKSLQENLRVLSKISVNAETVNANTADSNNSTLETGLKIEAAKAKLAALKARLGKA